MQEAVGFKQIIEERKCRCFHSFLDSSLETDITYFIGSTNDSAETELLWLEFGDEEGILNSIPSWIPLQKLRYLAVSNVEELWSTFQQQMQTNKQASFELRILVISGSPWLQNIPDLIEKFNHLEELHIVDSLEKTDITSLLQSLQQLSNLRLLELYGCDICSSVVLNLSNDSDSNNFEASTNSCISSLETIELSNLCNVSKLVISGDMCPRLRSLKVTWMKNLKEMNLRQLERLNTLHLWQCPELEVVSGLQGSCKRTKSLKSLQRQDCLEHIDIGQCHQLERIEGLEEVRGLKSLFIQVPQYGDPSVWNLSGRLRVGLTFSQCNIVKVNSVSLPSEYAFLIGKAVAKAKWNLNVSLFSEVIDAQTVAEVKRGEYVVEMTSSTSAITIYVLLITSSNFTRLKHKSTTHFFLNIGDCMVTGLLTAHDSIVTLNDANIKKGFMVTFNKIEGGKAINALQIIFDRLFRDSMVPKLAAYDVVKRKRK
ncbi:uncharacterized protein LOC131856308 [Cryptomeria japonica]|uniref:uncharacterized protein LOC131856308 n=1 Tax=Cryptomeria japonica TaxID=3369 RepID=UPI0027D9FAEA|nr:uncharacterized protein LOC131856308 [Cryptomeria japonica]